MISKNAHDVEKFVECPKIHIAMHQNKIVWTKPLWDHFTSNIEGQVW